MKREIPNRETRWYGFTLIELLVVISIIGILAALLLPAISGATKKSKVAKARSEAQTIVNATRWFYTEYGRFPHTGSSGDLSYGTLGDRTSGDLMNALRGLDGPGNVGNANNRRRIVFLEVPLKSVTGAGSFVDPWGNEYQVAVDNDYDGNTDTERYGTITNATVTAWSFGVDGKPETDDDVRSW